jgi:hypothetical protein
MIELACPESCSYLIEARTSASQREKELRKKEAVTPRALMLSDRALIGVNALERAIVQAQRGLGPISFREMNDADVLAAVEILARNLQTEESGLIYEHHGSAPKIDRLSRGIREAVEQMVNEIPPEIRPRHTDMVRAVEFTRDNVSAHLKRKTPALDNRSYIRFISLFHPWPEDATRPLIV